jgi:hypothetical protein
VLKEGVLLPDAAGPVPVKAGRRALHAGHLCGHAGLCRTFHAHCRTLTPTTDADAGPLTIHINPLIYRALFDFIDRNAAISIRIIKPETAAQDDFGISLRMRRRRAAILPPRNPAGTPGPARR